MPKFKNYKIKIIIVAVFIVAVAVSYFLGKQVAQPRPIQGTLREGGYNLVSPLLVCARDETSAVDQGVQTSIQNTVKTEIEKGNIVTASVYYRRFLDNSWALLNADETYYPASLNKVALMIAYYNWAEETDFPLSSSVYFPPGHDENLQQEIQPKNPIKPGQSYSAKELIDAMIKDSDNNAALLLLSAIDKNSLGKVFSDLNVPFLAPGQSPHNYIDVSQFAFFFRVLYNGTYLSHADSERALDVLSQSTFNDGLAAGIPPGTTIAHKFGLISVTPSSNTVTARELHDCGIIYPTSKSPYLLCVMTKSTESLQGAEQAIADISSEVYKHASK